MRGFIITVLLLTLITFTAALGSESIRQMIQQKARLTKSSLTGAQTHPVLRSHGAGITDGQETLATNIIDQAIQRYGSDLYDQAVFIQQQIEDSFSGRWNVEVFGGDPSWGRATYIRNDQWILLFGYGDDYNDYILWAPEC